MSIEMVIAYTGVIAVLKPIALIGGIIPHVGWVQDVKFHEKSPVLECGWVQGYRVHKSNTDKSPFAT